MKIIILGCGRVGSAVANLLNIEKQEVIIIDRDKNAFKRLGKSFAGSTIVGHAFDKDVLENAGIEHADAVAALTNGDNTNIVTARIARDEYRVPIVVARIYDPIRARIYRSFGILTVAPVIWTANKFKDLLTYPEHEIQATFGSGEVELTRVEISGRLAGKKIGSITIPAQIHAVAVTRLGVAFIPSSETVLEKGDVVRFAVSRSALGKYQEFIHGG